MQIPWAAAQWVPFGHRTPVVPHTVTPESAQAPIVHAIAPHNTKLSNRVIEVM
jgi:hypothetical protein